VKVAKRRSLSRSVQRAVTMRLAASAVVALLAAALLLTPSALRAAPEDEAEMRGPTPEVMSQPEVQAEVQRAIAEAEAAEERRRGPDQVAARERSRSAHAGLSDSAARQLAAETFPELLLEPSVPGLELPPGAELVQYLGDHQALISPAGEDQTDALLESTAPLRAENEAGDLRPVDSELIDRGAYMEPRNAEVEAELPEQLEQGIELPEADLEITPEGATEADVAALAGTDKLFYANSDTDTDFFATPTARGVETFWQLRSEGSPERHYLDYNLAAGEALKPAMEGLAAEVRRDGETIATISPPTAFDADGTAVPVEMLIEGDRLVLDVAHRSGDLKYPLIVDPITESDDFTAGAPCPALVRSGWRPFWRWEDSPTYAFFPDCNSGAGVATGSYVGNYQVNMYGQWVWQAPTDTYITRIDFGGVYNASGYGETTCTMTGIYNPAGYTWQQGSPWAVCAPHYFYNQSHVTSTIAYNNVAVFQLYMGDTDYRWYQNWNSLQRATFTIHESYRPTFSTVPGQTSPPANTSGWVDDTYGSSSRLYSHTIGARDRGTGTKRIEFRHPNPANPTQQLTQTANRSCSGTRGSQACTPNGGAYSAGFQYRLPEGWNTLYGTAFDQVNNATATSYQWTQRIDRSAPVVNAPSGSLVSDAARILPTRDYTLTFKATDGSLSSDSQQRSGVEQLEVYIDGESAPRFDPAQVPCTRTGRSCELEDTWQLEGGTLEDLAPGSHTVRMVGIDALGHRGERTFTITIRDDPAEADIQISAGLPSTDGSYDLSITATDPIGSGSYRSGIEALELYVDGVLLDTKEVPCPQGGCAMTWTRRMTVAQSTFLHEVAAAAYDRAGNSNHEYFGFRAGPDYEYFGYNDGFEHDVEVAAAGGANVIRFPVNWCDAQPTAGGPFVWTEVQKVYDDVISYNTNHLTAPLRTIPVLFRSPRWAAGGGGPSCHNGPPDAAHLPAWQAFVAAFAAEYGPNGPYGSAPAILAIEAWNEPNLLAFWDGSTQGNATLDPAFFARLVNRAAQATDLPVLPGGLSMAEVVYESGRLDDDPVAFMRAATDSSATHSIDPGLIAGISLHLYANKSTSTRRSNQDIGERYRQFRDALRAPFAGMDRWITEVGFPSHGKRGLSYATERKQRQRLWHSYLRFSGDPEIRSFITHRLRDVDPEIENGRFGVKHSFTERQGADKQIYCLFAERFAGLTPQCEEDHP